MTRTVATIEQGLAYWHSVRLTAPTMELREQARRIICELRKEREQVQKEADDTDRERMPHVP